LLKAALLTPSARESLFQTDRPLGSFGARIALAQRLGLIDPAVEQAPPTSPSAHQPNQSHLAESSRQARTNPLWEPLEQLVQQQLRLDLPSRPGLIGKPTAQDPALADFLLLITILVAFLEATAHQLKPLQPILVIGFSGITFAGDNPGDNKET
jgi:hypothetical protein